MAELDEIVVRITGDVSGLESAIGSVNSQLSSLGSGTGSGAVSEFNSIAVASDNAAIRIGQNWKKVGEGVDAVTKPLQVASVAVLGLGTASAMAAINFEDNFAAVKKTVDGTPEQIDAIKQSIIDMTTVGINGHSAIPLTTAELNELAAAGGQLGIQTENVTNFTETMAMLGTATNLSGEQGAQTLAKFANVTKMSQDKFDRLGSSIVDLGNNFATTEADIASMSIRLAGAGTQIGLNQADILGIATALSSVGIEAEMGGSAFSKAMIAMQMASTKGFERVNDVVSQTGMSLRDLQMLSSNNSKDFKSLADELGYTSDELNSMIKSGVQLESFAKITGRTSEEFKKLFDSSPAEAIDAFIKGLQNSDSAGQSAIEMLQEMGFTEVRLRDSLLRLASSEAGVSDAVQMSNKAWEENTALQTEFEAKAETTASKMAVAKNNAVEAARSFGEVMLPTIVDVTGGLSSMTQGMAKWNDGTKKAVVSAGALVVGLGAVSKGAAGTIKTVGGVVEGVGKIKGVLATGGALAEFAPTLTAIGSAAGPVALAVAGIGAAVLVAKASYDAWYKSNYRFAEGLGEQTEKLISQREQWQTLNDLRWEYNDLTGKINSNSLEGEQLDSAKSRLDEIVKILKNEYKIDVDSGDIDAALAKAEQLAKTDALKQETALKKQLDNGKSAYDRAVEKLPRVTKEYKDAEAAAEKYRDAQMKIVEYDNQYANHDISQTAYLNRLKEIMTDTYGENTLALGGFLNDLDHLEDKSLAGANATQRLNSAIAQLGEEEKKKKMDDLNASIDKYKQAAEGLADINLDHFTDAIKAGADGDKYLQRIAQYAKEGLVDADEFAKKAALIVSGQENVNSVFEQGEGAISSYVTDYVSKMQLFGASNEQVTVGLDSLAAAYTKFLDDAGKLPEGQHVEFTAEGEVIFVANYDGLEDAPDQSGTVNYDADYSGIEEPPVKRGTVIYEAVMPDSLKNTNYGKYGVSVFREARGTQNFEGGLAMVNDQKGIPDPRELIIDRGRAFIPEGKDVILPLSKGAKVYTAAETKRIMAGIPHYAEGKNNSDAFTAARDDWQHYTKTHAVTTAQELEKWLEFQEKYKKNEKDIWDIEEQVFSLRQKQYSEQVKASEQWLTHESKYNGLAVTEQLDAIDRIRKSTVAAYEAGLISHKEYLDTISSYDEKYIDKRKEQIAEMFDISKGYISDHTYFNDWGDNGDSPLEAYNRVKQDRLNELAAGELTKKEYDEYMTSLGSDMYAERREQSERWLEEQRKYFNMSAEDYAAGIDRMKKYTQEYYNNGLISRREYNEAMTELRHMELDEAESAYEEMLSNQSKYISEMRDKFSKQESELRSSWEVEDRATDMATVQKQLDLYSGAVTDRGQQKYKELQEQMKQLQRDEELYNLQVANNGVIENLEAEYSKLEADKASVLAGIAKNTDIDVSGIVGTLTSNLDGYAGSITTLLQTLINTVANKEINVPESNVYGPTYQDNRTITLTQRAEILPYMGGFR